MKDHKIQNILGLDSKDRYEYLIRKVAAYEQVFLIGEKGIYVTLGNSEITCIPVWPEFEITKLFLTGDWKKYTIKMIELNEFLVWLDQLESEGFKIAGFPNKQHHSFIVRPSEMKRHILAESE